MCMNGVPIGMVKRVTQVHHRITHRDQAVAVIAFVAVVAGTSTAAAVGLPVATGTIRTAGTPTSAFVWFFRRTDVSPYPLIPP